MKAVSLILFTLGAAFCSDVIDLTDSNFAEQTKNEDIMLIEFYAPWCGHCKRLAPEYETAATALLKNDPPVRLAKVDCTEGGKDSCSKFGVSGYPTLKIFRGGEFSSEYDGPRESAGIVSFMKKNSGPASVILKDDAHLQKKLADAEEVLVVGFFTSENDAFKAFTKAADSNRNDFSFTHTTDKELCAKHNHEDVVVLYRPKHLHAKFEAPTEVLSVGLTNTGIMEFIRSKHLGLVGQNDMKNKDSFKKPLVVVYYDLDWKRNLKGSRYYRNRVARVAKKFIGDVTFAVAAKTDFKRQISDWGFDEAKDSVHVVVHNEKSQVFKMEDTFSVDNLEKFVNEFKSGNLKAYVKSEPTPETNDGPVKVVVGEQFDEIVNDPTKDVLIEFYAPWCGHCKTLEPKFAELGEKFKDVKDIVIAKMDATANDVPPPYEVQGFPTIYYSPAGSKDAPKKYQGGREVADFIEYLKTEATNPFELADKKKKKPKKTDL